MNEDLLNTFGINEASNFVSTGTTGDKDIDQTVAATDFVQRSVASGATFPEIMESARKLSEPIQAKIAENLVTAAEDRPLTGSQMIASAVLQIAPILIGAAYSGKVGAGIGATAGVGGLGSYNRAIETRNERTRQSALAENKVLQGQLNNLNKQAMSAQEGMISQENKMNLAEFNRETALSKVRLADKLKKMEAETPNSEAFKNAMEALTGGEPIASEDLVGMSEKEQKRLTAYQTALARKEANQLSKEKTVQEKTEAEKKSRIVGLERVPDTGFDPADKKVASEMTAAKRELDIVINDIIESVNKNGIAWFGKEKGKQGVLASRLASSMRRFAGTGAALTAPEIPYLKELFFKAAGTEDLTTVIKEQLFSGGALNRMKELRNVVDKNYGDSLLAYNYYLPKANGDNSRFYSPNIYKDETYSFLKQEKAKPSTKTETRMYNGFEYEKSPSGEWVKVK